MNVRKFYLLLWSAVCLVGIFTLTSQKTFAAPATFAVTNTNDSGAGSLRQAIIDANSNSNPSEQDTVAFNITGSGAHLIALSSSVQITQPVVIDGFSQSGTVENSAAFPEPFNGTLQIDIRFATEGRIDVLSPNVTIQGVALSEDAEAIADGVIYAEDADNLTIMGSYISADFTGLNAYSGDASLSPNQKIIQIVNSDNVSIGSAEAAARNLFGYCNGACIDVSVSGGGTASNLQVQGNYFGLGADGLRSFISDTYAVRLHEGVENVTIGGDLLNGEGNLMTNQDNGAIYANNVDGLDILGNIIMHNKRVKVDAANYNAVMLLAGVTNAQIGLDSSGFGNHISGNWEGGAVQLIDSLLDNAPTEQVNIEGNIIGYNYDQSSILKSENDSISVEDSSNEIFISQNTIHNSQSLDLETPFSGVKVSDQAQKVAIIDNSIYDSSGIGIDLVGSNGADTNDELDADTGPNGRLNTPGYFNIDEDGGDTFIEFSADLPAGEYLIQFFSNTLADTDGPGEGETFIGSTTITSNGEGLQNFSATISGTGYSDIAQTATEIDDATPSGYGATSEFGTEGDAAIPEYDLMLDNRLLNPEDTALGNTLNYQLTITNRGPDDFNMALLDAVSPSNNLAALAFYPAQLAYSSTSSADVTCTDLGAGSASMFGPALANHSDHGIVFCPWTAGNYILSSGESYQMTLSFQVVDDGSLDFTNHIISAMNEYDIDFLDWISAVSGGDMLDNLANSIVNNYAAATSVVTDTEVNKVLLTEGELHDGDTLVYELSLTNNGPNDLDLTYFDASSDLPFLNALFTDLLPPNMTYVSQSNPDLNCVWGGPGSADDIPFFDEHPGYSGMFCAYIGSAVLESGQTISTQVTVEIDDASQPFTNELHGAAAPSDPDWFLNLWAWNKVALDGSGDVLNLIKENQNQNQVLGATYTPPTPETDGGGDNNNNNSGNNSNGNGTSNQGGLVSTGQAISVGLLLVVIFASSSLLLREYKKDR